MTKDPKNRPVAKSKQRTEFGDFQTPLPLADAVDLRGQAAALGVILIVMCAISLWIVNRDGSGLHKLADDAGRPAWGRVPAPLTPRAYLPMLVR